MSVATESKDGAAANIEKIDNFKIAVFGTHHYVLDFLKEPMTAAFKDVIFLESMLNAETAPLAKGYDAVCIFVNDTVDARTAEQLAAGGTRFVALRCAGFDRVDLAACAKHGIRVARVPAYSPRSVAEHAVALMFALARNLQAIGPRVQTGNYSLSGLIGFEISHKTVGVVGTGKIGQELIHLLSGFDCRIVANDVYQNKDLIAAGVEYLPLEDVLRQSDIISLHAPLMPSTQHLINAERLALMKPNAVLINVARGGLVDSDALLEALEQGKLAGAGLDVYENEGCLFFTDFTKIVPKDRMKAQGWDRRFEALANLPNVLITPHSAFCTTEALKNIADTTVDNLRASATGKELVNEVKP